MVTRSGWFTYTAVYTFHLTSAVDTLLVRDVVHQTVAPDGTITTYVDNYAASC